MKMVITVGLPASGKTTEAIKLVKESKPDLINVNRDDIRQMQFGGWTGDPVDEQMVTLVQRSMIDGAFKRDRSVIISDTNLNRGNVSRLVDIAFRWGAQVNFWYFDVDVDECIRRDEDRAYRGQRAVGEDAIMNMHRRYCKNGLPDFGDMGTEVMARQPYVADPQKTDAIIVDLDGTIALHNRNPYDYDSLHTDDPNVHVIQQVKDAYSRGAHVLFTSGRPDSHFRETAEWLRTHVGLYPRVPGVRSGSQNVEMFMRKTGDLRQDSVIKYEIFDKYIRKFYNVLYCLDDRNQVVQMWRSIGLNVWQVNEGDF